MNMPKSRVESFLKILDLQFSFMFFKTKIKSAIFLHDFQKIKSYLYFVYKILSIFYL